MSVFGAPQARCVWLAPTPSPRLELQWRLYRPVEFIGGSLANEGTKKAPEAEQRPTHDDPRHEDKNKQQQGGHKQDHEEHEKPTK
jgi:hypothetical protein